MDILYVWYFDLIWTYVPLFLCSVITAFMNTHCRHIFISYTAEQYRFHYFIENAGKYKRGIVKTNTHLVL